MTIKTTREQGNRTGSLLRQRRWEEGMDQSDKRIRISVRNLVEFVLRSGDIDNRRTAGDQKDAMQAGSRLHRKIQKKMGAGYRAEVGLKHQVEEDGFTLLVEGRADGILERDGQVIIDEIKCVYQDVSCLEEPVPIHLAQAMCYGCFYGQQIEADEITLQLTYCNLETEEIKRFQVIKTVEELTEWFAGLIHEYVKWARYLSHNASRRDESLRCLEFPFPYREGQKKLAASVYRTIERKRKLFIQAPTGIGKTLSTIYPALKAIGEGFGEKLFYLTAKTITRGVAEEALSILREKGLYFRSVTITAREKLCFLDKPECNPDACPYAKGHFDRVNDAVYHIIHQEFLITRDMLIEYAREHQVCPFEFCLDISNFVDGIICDYNYVFDPDVKLKRYFTDEIKGTYIFLIDEAHNLVPRARQMYSASLIKEDVLNVKRLIKGRSPRLTAQLDRVNQLLLERKRECETYVLLPDADHLASVLNSLFAVFETFMDDHREFENRDQVLDFYFMVRSFLNIYDRVDEHYQIYTELLEDGRFMLRLYCVNPIANLRECLDRGCSAVFFSATMLPIRYYRELLSNEPEDYAIYVDSPFKRENRLLLAASDVTSRYSRRGEKQYQRICSYIHTVTAARKGNYIIFLPSYQFLRQLRALMEGDGAPGSGSVDNDLEAEELVCIYQEQHMSEAERESFLDEFNREREQSMAAFCVMGGVFSEGIDLTADRLIGALIVGTGLPMVCTEQEILRGYFEKTEPDGFAFAYQYPGMNKVMQAAGRVIRTVDDRGVILLLDDRFLKPDYQSLFPREWSDVRRVTLQGLHRELTAFWEKDSKAL